MADVKLSRPAQGQHIVVPSTPDARMILDFSADQVNIDRPEGSNSLFFQFGDGASIELQNFYTAYNKEEMPEFQIDGQIIAGTDFFQAFGPDLLPAAGPAASAERGARYSEYANMSLAEGTWHLNELDYRLAFDGQQSTDEWQNGFIDNLAPTFSTGGAPITLGLTETGWDGKSPESPAPSVTGSFSVQDPDGDSLTATVSIGGKTVAVSLTGPTTVESDYGSLVITPKGGGSNITFNFEYTLKEEPYSKTDQLAEGEQVTDGIVITVNDGMGHTVTQPINVVITGSNDAPDIEKFDDLTLKDDGHFDGVYGKKEDSDNKVINANETNDTSPGGLTGAEHLLSATGVIVARDPDHGATLQYGIQASGSLTDTKGVESTTTYTVESFTPPADGPSPTTVSGCDTSITTDYGTFYLNSHTGEYEFVVNKDSTATNKLAEGQSITLAFHPTVTDGKAADLQFDVTRGHGTPTGGADGISITIMGSNDLPTASHSWNANAKGVVVDYVTEDSKSHNKISGTIVGKDVDANETETLRYGLFHPDGSGDGSGTMEKVLYVVPNGTDGDGNLLYSLLVTPPPDRNYYGELTITGAGASATYTFELNNTAKCVQALDNDSDAGSSLTVKFPIVIKDDFGGFVKEDIELTINGVNDAPKFISKDDEGNTYKYSITVRDEGVYAKGDAASEGEQLNPKENLDTRDNGLGAGRHLISAGGKIAVTDVDNGDNKHLAWGVVTTNEGNIQVSVASSILGDGGSSKTFYVLGGGTVVTALPLDSDGKVTNNYYGTFIIHDDGSYTFTANTAKDSPVDKLNEYNPNDPASFAKITVPLYANDNVDKENHNDVVKNITIFIRGSNEAPVLTGGTDLTITEHASSSTNMTPDGATIPYSSIFGTVSSTDADSDANPKYSLVLNPIYDDTTGVLTGGKVATTLYVMKDTGGNPILTSVPDDSTTHGNYFGKLVMGSGGTYTFTLYDDATVVQQMDANDSKEQKFTVAVQDSHGAYDYKEFSLTIKGANDAPVFDLKNGNFAGKVKESGAGVGVDSNVDKLNAEENTVTNATDKGWLVTKGSLAATDVDDVSGNLTYGIRVGGQDFFAKNASVSVDVYAQKGGVVTLANGYQIVAPGGTPQNGYEKCGTLTLKADGSWQFELIDTADAINGLREGVNPNITFTPIVTDSSSFDTNGKPSEAGHKVTSGTLTVTVEGSNEAPKLTLDGTTISVTDGGTEPDSVSFTSTDPDVDDSPNYRLVLGGDAANDLHGGTLHTTLYVVKGTDGTLKLSEAAAGEDTYGTLTVSDGTYKFTLADGTRAVQEMSGVDHKSITFNVAVVDGAGAYDHKPVTLEITGKNDAVQVTSTDAQVIQTWENGMVRDSAFTPPATEYNGSETAGGQFTVTQVDAGKNFLQYGFKVTTVTTVEGKEVSVVTYHEGSYTNEYGTFSINADGKYTFALNNNATATQNLAAGQTVKLGNVELAAWDTRHGTPGEYGVLPPATQKLEVYINGTNDKPTLTIDTQPTYTEDGVTAEGTAITGTLSVSDPEQTGGKTVAGVDSGTHGKFTFSLVGSATATAGDSTIMVGTYGWMQINEKTGEYTYTRTSDLNYLNTGQSVKETFYVRVMDANGTHSDIEPLVVTLTGQNDAASGMDGTGLTVHEHGVTGDAAAATGYLKFDKDNGFLGANKATGGTNDGKVTVSDVDNNYGGFKVNETDTEKVKIAVSTGLTVVGTATVEGNVITTEYGTFTLYADGTYTFAPNDNATMNVLKPGDSITITVPIQAESTENAHGKSGVDGVYTGTDTATGTITITIQGTNDAPVVDVQDSKLDVTYDSVYTGKEVTANFTTLAVDNAAIDYLTGHHDLLQQYVGEKVGDLVETLAARHDLLGFLINLGGKSNVEAWLTKLATAASLTADDLGKMDDILHKLNLGADVNNFIADKTDGRIILVDSDEIARWHKANVSGLTVHGNLNTEQIVDDVDHDPSELRFFMVDDNNPADGIKGNVVQQFKGIYGTLVLQPDGEYQYVLDRNSAAYKGLNTQQVEQETFTIYVRDTDNAVAEKPIELIINVQGGSGGDGNAIWEYMTLKKGYGDNAVKEDEDYIAKGSVWGKGPKVDDSLHFTDYQTTGESKVTLSGDATIVTTDYGTITLLPDGSYTYTLNNDHPKVQALCEKQVITQTFTVSSGLFGSSSTAAITITITGTNDKPVVTDQGDALTLHQHDSLNWTSTVGDTFTVRDIDKGEAAQLKIEAVSGGKDVSGNGPWIIKGDYGQYEITRGDVKNGTDAEFKYTYTLYPTSKDYNGSYDDKVTFAISDGNGGTVEKTLTTHLTADNAAPTVVAVDAEGNPVVVAVDAKGNPAAVTEDAFAGKTQVEVEGSVKGAFTDTDIKLGTDLNGAAGTKDNLTFSLASGASMAKGTYGTLFLNADGSYRYVLDNNNPAVQALGKDAEAYDTFTVKASDGTKYSEGAKLTITVKGDNDAPELTVGKVLTITESTVDGENTTKGTVSGTANVHDIDTVYATGKEDHNTFSIINAETKYGEFTVDSNGKYSFIIDNSLAAVKALKAGELVETKATLKVDDGNGGTAEQDIVVNIKGAASAPEVTAVIGDKDPSLPSDHEDYGYDINAVSNAGEAYSYTAKGQIVAKDYETKDYEAGTAPDFTASPAFTVKTQGAYGELTIDKNGKYTYTADAAKVEALGGGVEIHDTVTILLTAGNGLTSEQVLVIDILGANDAPVAAGTAGIGLPLTLGSLIPGSGWATDPKDMSILASDVDTGDHLSYSVHGADGKDYDITDGGSVHGLFGTLNFDKDTGEFHYQLNTDHADLVKLAEAHAAGTELKETFAYTASDNHGGVSDSSHIDVNVALTTGSGNEQDTHGQLIFGGTGDDPLSGGGGNDILSGGTGDDILYGNGGDDYLFGGAGNDFLDGGYGLGHLYGEAGVNHLYGGEGNDIMVYHDGDILDGGAGLDFMLVDSTEGLNSLLGAAKGVEVAIKGDNDGQTASELGLTNLDKLADVGIHVAENNVDGKHTTTMTLSDAWTHNVDGTYTNGTAHLTLSTTLTNSGADEKDEVAKFVMTHSS